MDFLRWCSYASVLAREIINLKNGFSKSLYADFLNNDTLSSDVAKLLVRPSLSAAREKTSPPNRLATLGC